MGAHKKKKRERKRRQAVKYNRSLLRSPERVQALPWLPSLSAGVAPAAAAASRQPVQPKSTRELLEMPKTQLIHFLQRRSKVKQEKGSLERGWLKSFERSSSLSGSLITEEEKILVGQLRHTAGGNCSRQIAHAWDIPSSFVDRCKKAYCRYQNEQNQHDANVSVSEIHEGNLERNERDGALDGAHGSGGNENDQATASGDKIE